jgi:pyridoxamine 5'-phosphate oxidase
LEQELPSEPLSLFTAWFEEARRSEATYEYNGATLATATRTGRPSARVVLVRNWDERGFCFYTNYESSKGAELAENPWAALVFWWGALGRQIRIEGQVEQLTAAESDAYYQSRARGSQLGAWASAQSQVIPNRTVLEEELERLERLYANQPPPRPPYWGGYRVAPGMIEFWQSGLHRLHDRLRYIRQDDGAWLRERLAP